MLNLTTLYPDYLFFHLYEEGEVAAFTFFLWSCALLHPRAELAPELVEQGKVTRLGFPQQNQAKRESLFFS